MKPGQKIYTDILKLKTRYPKLHIHYWDNGEWSVYKNKREAQKEDAVALMECNDYGEQEIGYAKLPMLLFANALGITIDSI